MIKTEIQVLKKIDHPNIIKLLDSYYFKDKLHMVYELCEEGDLQNLITKKNKLSEKKSRDF